MQEIVMPKAGLSMEEGTVVRWIKVEGEAVNKGDVLCEIETDKVTIEEEAPCDGVMLKILVPEGVPVPVVTPIAYVGQPGESVPAVAPVAYVEPAGAVLPEGASPTKAPAAHLEPAQAPSDMPKPEAVDAAGDPGVLNPAGVMLATPFARYLCREKGIDITQVPVDDRGIVTGGGVREYRPGATPLAAAKAASQGMPLTGIRGSGEGGKIRAADLPSPSIGAQDAAAAEYREDRRVPLRGMRKTIARRMAQSHADIPPVTLTTPAGVNGLLALRSRLNGEGGPKLSLNDFVLRAVAVALSRHPQVNTSLEEDAVIYRSHVHVAMAVGMPEGLIVPVIRDADRLGIYALSYTAKDLAVRARAGKLAPQELEGGTFTVSNLGMYGITHFNPIINQPHAAILGVCAVQDQLALAEDGKVVAGKVMNLCLTHDHRLIDGTAGAEFLQTLRELLENPLRLICDFPGKEEAGHAV